MKTSYPLHSAGRLMTDEIPIVQDNITIKDVKELIFKEINKQKSINYIYITDNKRKLKGVISIKELFRQADKNGIKSLMKKSLVTVDPHADQEKVAFLALKHNIKSVPVVSRNGILLGSVLSDDILDIAYHKSQEDIARFVGAETVRANIDDVSALSLLVSVKHRLPWLVIGLLGGLVAAQVISSFDDVLQKNLVIAAFIPLIVYMASAVQNQAAVFIIRDLALGRTINMYKYSLKHLRVIFSLGLIISALMFLLSYVFYGDLSITIALSLAIFITILSSILTGLAIPYLFYRLKYDPANASGPIATIIQDLLSVFIYLLVVQSIL